MHGGLLGISNEQNSGNIAMRTNSKQREAKVNMTNINVTCSERELIYIYILNGFK